MTGNEGQLPDEGNPTEVNDSDDVETLRQQLSELSERNQQLEQQNSDLAVAVDDYDQRYRNLEKLHGRHTNELGELRALITAFKPEKQESQERVVVPQLGDPQLEPERFTTNLQQELAALKQERLEIEQKLQQQQQQYDENLNKLRSQLDGLQSYQLYSLEEKELKDYGLNDQDIQQVRKVQEDNGLPSLKSALPYSTAFQKIVNSQQQTTPVKDKKKIDTAAAAAEAATSQNASHRNGTSAPGQNSDWRSEVAELLRSGRWYQISPEERKRYTQLAEKQAASVEN